MDDNEYWRMVRVDALDRAMQFHRDLQHLASEGDIISTARHFESFLAYGSDLPQVNTEADPVGAKQ